MAVHNKTLNPERPHQQHDYYAVDLRRIPVQGNYLPHRRLKLAGKTTSIFSHVIRIRHNEIPFFFHEMKRELKVITFILRLGSRFWNGNTVKKHFWNLRHTILTYYETVYISMKYYLSLQLVVGTSDALCKNQLTSSERFPCPPSKSTTTPLLLPQLMPSNELFALKSVIRALGTPEAMRHSEILLEALAPDGWI